MGASISEKLTELNITLPSVAAPVAAYVPAVKVGNQVWTSGQLPFIDGQLPATGKWARPLPLSRRNPMRAPRR